MRIWTVVRKEYLERVRSKSFLVGTILGPALMSMFIVVPMLLEKSGTREDRTVAVVDPSGRYLGPLSDALRDRGAEHLTLLPISAEGRPLDAAVEELKEMILEETVHSGMVIDPDFTENRQATFYNRSVSALVMRDEVLRPALDRVLRASRFEAAGVPESLHTYLSAATEWNSRSVSDAGGDSAQNDEAAVAVAFAMIMILYIMVLMYGGHVLTAVIEEKGSRIVEVLLVSLPPQRLMMGKVLGVGLAGLTQFAVWTGALVVASLRGVTIGEFALDPGMLSPLMMVSFLVFFLLGFLLYSTIYAGVGAMCNSVQDSQQFHMPLTMGLVVPMLMLSFVMRAPDHPVSIVLSLVPLFAPVLMFMRICIQTPPLWQVLLSWLLLGAAIWGTMKMAGKLFRVGILMYGTSPTWATLGRALRRA